MFPLCFAWDLTFRATGEERPCFLGAACLASTYRRRRRQRPASGSRQIGAAAAGFGSQRAEPAVSSGERRRWWGSGDDDAAARSVRPRGGSGGGRTEAEVEAGAVGEGKVVVAREVRVRGGRSVLTRRPAR